MIINTKKRLFAEHKMLCCIASEYYFVSYWLCSSGKKKSILSLKDFIEFICVSPKDEQIKQITLEIANNHKDDFSDLYWILFLR